MVLCSFPFLLPGLGEIADEGGRGNMKERGAISFFL
jgi:hypothetical protein